MEGRTTYIFGAKATAAGLYKALSLLKPEQRIEAFLVSDTTGNVPEIWGVPVKPISSVAGELSENEKQDAFVYAAVPELVHAEIRKLLESYGFRNLVMLDSRMEAELMEQCFEAGGRFRSVHGLPVGVQGVSRDIKKDEQGENGIEPFKDRVRKRDGLIPNLTIYAASFYKDKSLSNPPVLPEYVKKLYLGCDGAVRSGVDIRGQADFYDNMGDNISSLNPNRCEMTAHYWVWKNRLGNGCGSDAVIDRSRCSGGTGGDDSHVDYVGICHYRRLLELSDEDLMRMVANDVDVVLPYPMIHYPNAAIQHTWYVPEKDWELMRRVVDDLYPEYGERFEEVFNASEFYNYNMLVAKKSVFADYCAWLYPILDRIEELSEPKGRDRHDRYTAYLSESLETLYFMTNLNGLRIYHTGRLLYT